MSAHRSIHRGVFASIVVGMDSRASNIPRWIAALWLATACADDLPDDGGQDTMPDDGTTTEDDGGSPTDDTLGGGSSGGVDETGVGMDDDMPLVTSIPDIKQGHVAPGTLVLVPGAVATTPSFVDGDSSGAMIQDPEAMAFGGLRLRTAVGLPTPTPATRVDVIGELLDDASTGPVLHVSSLQTRGAAVPPDPIATTTGRVGPGGTLRTSLSDMVIQLVPPAGQSLHVDQADDTESSFVIDDGVVVELAPFDVDLPVPAPGTRLAEVTGVLVLVGQRSLVWPLTADHVILAE